MWGQCNGGGWWGFGMGLIAILLITAVVVGVLLLVRPPHQRAVGQGEGGRALEILDERFARGEIDQQEYEERRRLLGR